MLQLTQIKNLANKITLYSKDYSECSKTYSELKDFLGSNLELTCDSFKLINFIKNFYSMVKLVKFEKFLEGFNIENPKDDDIERLINYIDNEDKAEFIADTFDKILNSNSKIACCIMGMLFNKITKDDRDIIQSDLVLINALSRINDYDIKNFVYLMSICKCKMKENSNTLKITDEIKEECKKKYNISDFNLNLSLNTLFNTGLLERTSSDIDYEGVLNLDDIYSFNRLSEILYNYAKKITDNL